MAVKTWPFALKEEHRLLILENKSLRIIFRSRRDENGEWRKLHNKELGSSHHSHNIVRVIKSRRLMEVQQAARLGESRSVFKIVNR